MRLLAMIAACGLTASAYAQSRFVFVDRDNDALLIVDDRSGNGFIEEPSELSLAFNAFNAAGTPSFATPFTLGVRADGLAVLGEVTTRSIYLFRDWNRDGDFQDVGESWIAADPANLSGIALPAPSGSAFDAQGRLYIANAGNANGNDAVYRLVDLTNDREFQDADEIKVFIGAGFFGPGNGPYSPQEVAFTGSTPLSGYFRNSSTNLHGIYRFIDTDQNDNCDNASEVSLFWGAGNAAAITPSAGLALELDAARPGAVYTLQIATGGVDQLIRARDLTLDNDAQDADESAVVFSTAEEDFSAADILSLANGQVLLTETSGARIIILTDMDNDNLFITPGERATYFANTTLAAADARFAAPIARPCRPNCDDSTGSPILTANDFACFLNAFVNGSLYANCDSSTSSPLLTANDFACFLNAYADGCS